MTDATDPSPPLPDSVPPPRVAPTPSPPPRAPAPVALDADTGWRPLPRAARTVRMLSGALLGAMAAFPLWILTVFRSDFDWLWSLLALAALAPVLAGYGAWVAARQWAATRWRLDARGLQVRRGRMFQREVLVPRSRVQHMDLERGPIERRFGLATIVVHTAGTRLQALRQSGLADADAVTLRDALVPDADVDDDAV